MTSNRPSTWQTHLDPKLVQRLNRPLKQPGVTNHQMANRVIERSQSLLNRLPLLEQQMYRWSTIVDIESEQTPIVYAHLQEQENRAVENLKASTSSSNFLDIQEAQNPLLAMSVQVLPNTAIQEEPLVNLLSNPSGATESSEFNKNRIGKSTLALNRSTSTQSLVTTPKSSSSISNQGQSTVVFPQPSATSLNDVVPSVTVRSPATPVTLSVTPIHDGVIQLKQERSTTTPDVVFSQMETSGINPTEVADGVEAMPLVKLSEAVNSSSPINSEITRTPDIIVTSASATRAPVINESSLNEAIPIMTARSPLTPMPVMQAKLAPALSFTEVTSLNEVIPIATARLTVNDSILTSVKPLVIEPQKSQNQPILLSANSLATQLGSLEKAPLTESLNSRQPSPKEEKVEKIRDRTNHKFQSNSIPTVQVSLDLLSPQFEPLILSRPDIARYKANTSDSNPVAQKVNVVSTVDRSQSLSSSPQYQRSTTFDSSVNQSISPSPNLSNSPRNRVDSGVQSSVVAVNVPQQIDLDALVDKMERQLMRRLVVESERRGNKKWH